ncbi:MAG: hypothetical protein ACOX6T_27190 [Myxococcales bacterium]
MALLSAITAVAWLGAAPAQAIEVDKLLAAEQQPPPSTNSAVDDLLRFWAYDRLVLDGATPVPHKPVLKSQIVAKSTPDECFNGVGQPYPEMTYDESGQPVCQEGVPKRNEAYIWGLAESAGFLYFGTLANTNCLVEAGYLEQSDEYANPYWVCEFAAAASGRGDSRPPNLYRYNIATKELTRLVMDEEGESLLARTGGIRSAGALGDVVILAGGGSGGVNFFAFDGPTGQFLGAKNLTAYNDIRQWTVYNGVLYTAVGTRIASCGDRGGAVLRWSGTKEDPIQFREVGDLDSLGAYLTGLGGRLYISTWPSDGRSDCVDENGAPVSNVRIGGLVRGPLIPPGGLTEANQPAEQWEKIFSFDQYDPDPIAARSYGGGPVMGFDGALFLGTMHVPLSAATRAGHLLDLSGATGQNALTTMLGTHRAISIFRLLHPGSSRPVVDILYGELYLPTYDPVLKRYRIAYDAAHRNKLGKRPLFGASGFGSFWNNYTWIMNIFQERLYVGTMDWSELARVNSQAGSGQVTMEPPQPSSYGWLLGSFAMKEGADLYRFDSKYGAAKSESLDGLGNFTNYGFRTVLNAGGKMFVGTANPMNVHPRGGWELVELTGKPHGFCAGLPDGTPCCDKNACTQNDTCQGGVCVGGDPVVCMPLNECHEAGVCDPSTGLCSNPVKADGSLCDDADACTEEDACIAGYCVGNLVIPEAGVCRVENTCDPNTGEALMAEDGTPCPGGICQSGVCVPKEPHCCGCSATGGASGLLAGLLGLLALTRRRLLRGRPA